MTSKSLATGYNLFIKQNLCPCSASAENRCNIQGRGFNILVIGHDVLFIRNSRRLSRRKMSKLHIKLWVYLYHVAGRITFLLLVFNTGMCSSRFRYSLRTLKRSLGFVIFYIRIAQQHLVYSIMKDFQTKQVQTFQLFHWRSTFNLSCSSTIVR